MMICRSQTPGNQQSRGRWKSPPWTTNSPEWRRLDAKVPADHLARQIDALVDLLDLSPLYASYRGVGSDAYPPELLLKVALYHMQCGVASPAQWTRNAHFDEVVQWLAMGVTPNRSRWYEFRRRVGGELMDQFNAQILQLLGSRTRKQVPGEAPAE